MGYEAGAKAAKPDIKVDTQYISPEGDFSGFSDPAKGQIVAQGMYDAGADIVFQVAGGSGLGVFQAAAASNKRAIGVDSDQYKTVDDPALQAVIMTSMLKRVDNSVQAYIDDFVDGGVTGGKDVISDLNSRRRRPGHDRWLHRRHQGPDRRLQEEDHRRRHQGSVGVVTR